MKLAFRMPQPSRCRPARGKTDPQLVSNCWRKPAGNKRAGRIAQQAFDMQTWGCRLTLDLFTSDQVQALARQAVHVGGHVGQPSHHAKLTPAKPARAAMTWALKDTILASRATCWMSVTMPLELASNAARAGRRWHRRRRWRVERLQHFVQAFIDLGHSAGFAAPQLAERTPAAVPKVCRLAHASGVCAAEIQARAGASCGSQSRRRRGVGWAPTTSRQRRVAPQIAPARRVGPGRGGDSALHRLSGALPRTARCALPRPFQGPTQAWISAAQTPNLP